MEHLADVTTEVKYRSGKLEKLPFLPLTFRHHFLPGDVNSSKLLRHFIHPHQPITGCMCEMCERQFISQKMCDEHIPLATSY